MPQPRRQGITDALRQRLLDALTSGALRDGSRLPSTRELARDLKADPRVVAEAYRALVDEGLVVMRPRSGVFLSAPTGTAVTPQGAGAHWVAEVIADGIRRGIPAPELADAFAAATRSRSLYAAVIGGTDDQAAGIARELREDFGVQAAGVTLETLGPAAVRANGGELPRGVARAHFLVGTELTEEPTRTLATRLGVPCVIIDIRPDLLSPDWRLLLRQVTYVVVADPKFAPLVRTFLEGVDGAGNVRLLIAGRDDLSVVPPDAPTYVTEAARERLGRHRLPGRLVAPVRTLSDTSARTIAFVMVQLQLAPRRRSPAAPVAVAAARRG